MLFMPESPRWLAKKGKNSKEVLTKIYRDERNINKEEDLLNKEMLKMKEFIAMSEC